MSLAQQFFLAVYEQTKRIALIVLPVLIRRGWSAQERLAALGTISIAVLLYVAVVFLVTPAVA